MVCVHIRGLRHYHLQQVDSDRSGRRVAERIHRHQAFQVAAEMLMPLTHMKEANESTIPVSNCVYTFNDNIEEPSV